MRGAYILTSLTAVLQRSTVSRLSAIRGDAKFVYGERPRWHHRGNYSSEFVVSFIHWLSPRRRDLASASQRIPVRRSRNASLRTTTQWRSLLSATISTCLHVALLFTYYKIVHEVHAIRTDSKNNENCKSSTRHKHWIKHHIICQCVMSPIKPKLIATHVGAGVSRDQDICATCTTNCWRVNV